MGTLTRNKLLLYNNQVLEEIYDKLNGKIFHVTSAKGIKGVEKSGIIHHNKDNRFKLTHDGHIGYGLRNGFVSFFDLRNINVENQPHDCVYFPRPNSWSRYSFLIFNPKYYHELKFQNINGSTLKDILPKDTKLPSAAEPANYIPKYECWYPANCPLDKIIEVLDVQIIWTPQEETNCEKRDMYKRITENNTNESYVKYTPFG